jgi:hypothetical protein
MRLLNYKVEIMENEESKLASLFWIADSVSAAPIKTLRHGVWYELIIGIGNNHTAHVTIDDEALKVLCERNAMNFDEIISKGPIKEGA